MIAKNVKRILTELPANVELVAATKKIGPDQIEEAYRAGVKIVGENYLKDALVKFKVIGNKLKWHFIGHLQKNKAKVVVGIFDMVETLDSCDLAYVLDKECKKMDKIMPVLIEVNSANEPQKHGLAINQVEGLLEEILQFSNLKPMGLMTMGPWRDDPEELRPYFKKTKELFNNLRNTYRESLEWSYLSMGMSSSYKVAIEEGANIVRIGTGIFGERS